MKQVNWKKRLIQAAWLLAGIGTVVLLGAAMKKKDRKKCTDIKIEITGVEKQMFIDEKDVAALINSTGMVTGSSVSSIDLREMENIIEKNPWVKNAEMFFDNKQVLQVRIEEREPVARIFSVQGESCYLDSSGMRLPLSEKISARVPMFTNFPSDKTVLSGPDSALLKNVVRVGRFILTDSFWIAQVSQVNITPQSEFELIPVIGDHVVVLGNAEELDNKFRRLYTFYQQAWLQNGISKYEKLDVQYQNEVVAVKRGTAKAMIDSAAARTALERLVKGTPGVLPDSVSGKKNIPDSAGRSHPVAPVVKTKTVAPKNNKTNNKPLTKKLLAKAPLKTNHKNKPVANNKPKAVMDKK